MKRNDNKMEILIIGTPEQRKKVNFDDIGSKEKHII